MLSTAWSRWLRACCAATLLLLPLALAGEVIPDADPSGSLPHAVHGYDLFCWQNEAGAWRFTLLYSINRLRAKSEVENAAVQMMEDVALQKLSGLPKGETVAWYTQDQLPAAVVDEIRAACSEAQAVIQDPVPLSFATDVH